MKISVKLILLLSSVVQQVWSSDFGTEMTTDEPELTTYLGLDIIEEEGGKHFPTTKKNFTTNTRKLITTTTRKRIFPIHHSTKSYVYAPTTTKSYVYSPTTTNSYVYAPTTTYLGLLWPVVFKASMLGASEEVKALMKNNVNLNVNAPDVNGITPLFWASKLGHSQIAHILIENGAKADAKTNSGLTPLFVASENGHVEVVRMLLNTKEGKSTLNTALPETEATPLFQAVWNNHSDVVRMLLKFNETSVDEPDKHGQTPLYGAIANGQEDTVRLLLENGARLSNIKLDPLSSARISGFTDFVNKMLDSIPVMNTSKLSGNTYSSMTLNLDTRARGVVVMISWVDRVQFRFKLDSQLRDILKQRRIDPDTSIFSLHFSDQCVQLGPLFTAISDFRANMLLLQLDDTMSCPSKTMSCVKVPDIFNIIQETLQHLYNLYTAYVPVLHIIYPQNRVIHQLYMNPFLCSVMLPVCWLAAVLLVLLPCCSLSRVFIKQNKNIEIDDVPLGSIKCLEVFQDSCPCAQEENTKRNHETEKRATKEKRFQCLLKWGLLFFSISIIFMFPYAIKIIKSFVNVIFKDSIANSSSHSSRWLVVVFKFLGLFIFDTKFGQLSSCSQFSNSFLTGFWADVYGNGDQTLSGKEYLEYILKKQQEKFSVLSAGLASSSLSLSLSILFHLVSIYMMLHCNFFKKFRKYWNSRRLQNQAAIIIMILVCLAINISRYFMCIQYSNIWIIFLIRLAMISICTPSSILLEWICIRLYQRYLAIFKYKILQVLSYGAHSNQRKEKALSDYLGRGFLGHNQLYEWKTSVSSYTTVIESLLEQKTGHHFKAIDTGSIVERFGLPLGSDNRMEDLETDHDLMLVATDVLVSDREGSSVLMVPNEDLVEYVFLVSQNSECCLMENIIDEEDKIDTFKAKTLLDSIVTNVSMRDFQMETLELKMSTLIGLSCLTVTQRLVQWNRISTKTTGPAVNFKVKTAHLNPSWMSHDEWVRQIDCDFILAFHLDHWPEVAREWVHRPRSWPSQEVVDRIVTLGCEVVPKVGSDQGRFGWRLSFSQVEHVLSCHVGEKARKTYLAVKIFLKRTLKKICPFLKTYHLKTVFFHYMESKTEKYWQDTNLVNTIRDLLEFLSNTVESGHCPHYFIPSVNLWGEQILGKSAKKVPMQAKRGCQLIRSVMRKNISDFILPLSFKCDLLLQSVFSARSIPFYARALGLVLVTELVLMASLPVLGLSLFVLTQTIISWLIGMVGCLPSMLIFILMMLVLKKCV